MAVMLALAAPAASADPGNGKGWTTEDAVCDGGVEVQITGHEGLWSATHLNAENQRLILTSQLVTLDPPDGDPFDLFNLSHPGHKNQEPDLENCYFSFDTPDGLVEIWLTGFLRP